MAGSNKIILILTTTFIAFCAVKAVDTSLTSRICNGNLYNALTLSHLVTDDLVNRIVEDTPTSVLYESYDSEQGVFLPLLYARGACTITITNDECSLCLQSAKDQLFKECSKRGKGAQIHLGDCRIRYEEYRFTDDG